ncbi:MAG: PKD domain-containing protein [Xanthomonadales bacterium]|nr:PKD domain-containing protein [Xanthomonadales bacterium]
MTMHFDLKAGVCCAAVLLAALGTNANAQLSESKGSDPGVVAPPEAKSQAAVRTGRAPSLQELLKRSGKQPGDFIPRSGEINRHALPRDIELNALLEKNAPSDNVLARERSNSSATRAPSAILSIEGYSNDDNVALVGGRIAPPDTNGDVGIDHYVMYVNLGWVFFNKDDGSVAGGPFPGNIFWQGFGGVCENQNAGDPIVLYDHLAGRWLFSQFTGTVLPDGHQCVAISDGEDPAGPYTLYDFNVSPGAFNDYPKIGVWPDGYYMTTHEFAGNPLSFAGVNLTIFDRTSMLAGDPNAGFVQFTNSTSGDPLEFGVMAGNLEGPSLPPAGTCNYLVHATDVEAFGGPGPDRYRMWEACVNFDNPNASTLSQIDSVAVPPFDKNLCGFSRDCIQQPGPQNLDSLAAMTLYRFNLRFFPNEGVLRGVSTTNVDVGGDRAGVQWIGIDIDPANNGTSITDNGDQLGVIDFGDGENRWMGSATIDQDGNVGIGYTRASNSTFPSIFFTVHERGVDGPGAVQQESVCVNGTGSAQGINRWADYASASMDPVDQCTFWISNEYVQTTGNFEWNTRVCSFRIPSCGNDGNTPPVADFNFSCNELSCNFDANASSDSDGNIVSYSWDFGDGTNGSGVTTSNVYSNSGSFNVTLTVTDNDGASDSASQTVTVTAPPTGNCPAGSINFNAFATTSFSNQDNTATGSVTVEDGGDTLALQGNRWRASVQTFEVTPDTVVEFQFASNLQGEIHGIGFDEDDILSADRIFRFFGTQNFGFTFEPQYSGSGNFETFRVPVGQTFTGSSMRLLFVNDRDAPPQEAEGRFRCVRVFEDVEEPPRQCALQQDFDTDSEGWFVPNNSTCATGNFIRGTPSEQSDGGVITQVGGDNTSGSGSAMFTAPNSSVGVDDVDDGQCILLSPVVDVTEDSTLNMAYFHGQRDTGDDARDFFALEVSTDGGSTFRAVALNADEQSNAVWTDAPETAIPAGSQVQIRVRAEDGPADGDLVEAGLDDVNICPVEE